MDTSALEMLLERLIDKQDELIARLESLEYTLGDKLDEVNKNICELQSDVSMMQASASRINDELNWWSSNNSFAKQLLSALSDASSEISDLKFNASQIHDELNWWGEGHSLAKQLLSALGEIESAVRDRDV